MFELFPILKSRADQEAETMSGGDQQMVQDALEVAHRGYVVQTGRVVLSWTSDELLQSDDVRKAYMGM